MRFFLRLALVVFVLAIAGGVGATYWVRLQLFTPLKVEGIAFAIEPGLGASEILRRLETVGALSDARVARLYLIHRLGDPPLKAGEYELSGELDTPGVLDKLIRGEVVTHPVTLLEGRVMEEIADALAEAGFGDRESFLAFMQDPQWIKDLDPRAPNLEGYLYPDTYRFARGTSEKTIVKQLVDTFRRRFEERVRPVLEESDLDFRELVTLASIIEKEALLDDERPIIAGVYSNRLERGIALYADPTVIYALRLQGTWDGNIRKPDLQIDSPYNTYRYPGLPPGPICSPGIASLVAAATPASVPYLYFVSRNDGSHVFARTLSEHNRNVQRWQKEYWRQKWAAEKRRQK